MNPIKSYHNYLLSLKEKRDGLLLKLDKIFSIHDTPLTPLKEEFYDTATSLGNIEGIEALADALVSPDSLPVPFETTRSFWSRLFNDLPALLNLPPTTVQALETALDHLQDGQQVLTSERVIEKLAELEPDQSLVLPLTPRSPISQTTENLAIYKKNRDGSFDITLYGVKPGASESQGGEFTLGWERASPCLFFKSVPVQELFGPNYPHETSGLHGDSLVKALATNRSNEAVRTVFHPFAPYQSTSSSPFARLVEAGHPSSLKGWSAYFYDAIAASLPQNSSPKEALDIFKAIAAIGKTTLSLGLFHALSKAPKDFPLEKLLSHLSLLSGLLQKTALTLKKLTNNPYLIPLKESLAASLAVCNDETDQLIRMTTSEIEELSPHLSEDQIDAAKRSLISCQGFLEDAGLFEDKKSFAAPPPPLPEWIPSPPSPNSPLFLPWLEALPEKLEGLPDDVRLPFLTQVIYQMPLPGIESPWETLEVPKIALIHISKLSHLLASEAFKTKTRFAASTQNAGAVLLCLTHHLAELMDEQGVLNEFFPDFTLFKQLTQSPYYQGGSYTDWEKRQEILRFIKTREKKQLWSLEGDQADRFAAALLEGYPSMKEQVDKELDTWFYSNPSDKHKLKPETALMIGLLGIETPTYNPPPPPKSHPFAALARTAMHTRMLLSEKAKPQEAFSNQLPNTSSWDFDLKYGRITLYPSDYLSKGKGPQKIALDPHSVHNLLPQKTGIESQNATLRRTAFLEESLFEKFSSFEEAASQPGLMIATCFLQLKSHLSLLKTPELNALLEKYVFKLVIEKDGTEQFPLLEEMETHPDLLAKLLGEWLSMVQPENVSLDDDSIALYFMILKLYQFSSQASCFPLLKVLTPWAEAREKEWREALTKIDTAANPKGAALLKLLLLDIYQTRLSFPGEKTPLKEWETYLRIGQSLREQEEQGTLLFSPEQLLAWNKIRVEMARRFNELVENNPQDAQKILNLTFTQTETSTWDFSEYPLCQLQKPGSNEKLDLLSLTTQEGKLEPIPQKILQQHDFKRVFSDQVRFWKKSIEGDQEVFYIKEDREYRYATHAPSVKQSPFPYVLQKKEGDQWLTLIHYERADVLCIPSHMVHEALWWINPTTDEITGCYLNEPDKVWIRSDPQGFFRFEEGPEKGNCLERVEHRTSSLEDALGLFGCHHFAYKKRLMGQGISKNFRDLMVFPYIKNTQGKPLIFERNEFEFFQQGAPERKLAGNRFQGSYRGESYNLKRKGTLLNVSGLYIETSFKDFKDGLHTHHQYSLIIPLCKHSAESHSSVLKPIAPRFTREQGSLVSGIGSIEIPIKNEQFQPQKPIQALFAAYLYLVGKDYEGAHRALKKIRPGDKLEANEREILKWLIDSKEDAHDTSSEAAGVKLRAYRFLATQGMPLTQVLLNEELPETTLETIYIDYLRHSSSVPRPLKISGSLEKWIFEEGFKRFPPNPENRGKWQLKKEELGQAAFHVEVRPLPILNKLPLLEYWKEIPQRPAGEENPLLRPEKLFEGIMTPQEVDLIPGEAYPIEAFGLHYRLLSSKDTPQEKKWELVYLLDTLWIPYRFLIALKKALALGEKAPPLPVLDALPSYEKSAAVEAWLEKLAHENLPPQAIEGQKAVREKAPLPPAPIHSQEAVSSEEKFLQKLKAKVTERASISHFKILEELRKSLQLEEIPHDPIEAAPLFDENEAIEGLSKEEVKEWTQEYTKGKETLTQTARYRFPSEEQLAKGFKLFNRLDLFLVEENLTLEIVRQLNRAPVTKEIRTHSEVDEVSRDKTPMPIEDAFRLMLLPHEKRLLFLHKKNQYLTLRDLEIIETLVTDYLELKITKNTLVQLENKFLAFKKSVKEKNQPLAEELWQEIGELATPYQEHLDEAHGKEVRQKTLLFEFMSGLRIRKEQAEILSTLTESLFAEDPAERDFSVVFQLIMAGGKTSVILSRLAQIAAAQGQTPLFLTHHSQHASVKAYLSDAQFKRFRQDVVELSFSREELASLQVLNYVHTQLTAAKDKKRLPVMPTQFLEMLQLEYISQLHLLKNPPLLDPQTILRVELLAKILLFIKSECLLMADEVDLNINILQSLHFPSGAPTPISKTSLGVIKQVYTLLATDLKLAPLLNLQEDDQALAQTKFKEEVFPTLAEALIASYPPLSLLIPLENYASYRESLKEYLLGKIEGSLKKGIEAQDEEAFFDSLKIPPEKRAEAKRHLEFMRHLEKLKKEEKLEVKEGLSALALAKQLIHEILPLTLSKSFNKNYGFAGEGQHWKLINYLGVDAEAPTECGNVYEMACEYFQAALAKKVTPELLEEYRVKMEEASLYYAHLYHIPPDQTNESQHFEAMTGLPLHGNWTTERRNEALQQLSDPVRCLDFYAEFAPLALQYHRSLLQCSPTALAYMGAQFVGCSGTLWNKDTFAREIAENCMVSEGVEGKILAKLASCFEKEESHLLLMKKADVNSVIEGMLQQRSRQELQENFRAIIDVGGLFKRFTNREIAESIMSADVLDGHVDATLFLLKEGQKESFALFKRGSDEPIYLKGTTRQDLEAAGVDINRLFVYFDELRTTGSDIPLKADAIATLTFDPHSTTMRSFVQGALRERGFFRSQRLDIALLASSLEGIANYNRDAPEESLAFKNIALTAARNQSKALKHQLVRSAMEQLKECYRSQMILDSLPKFASRKEGENWEAPLNQYGSAEWLFFHEFEDDPARLFLDLPEDTLAYEIVEALYKKIEQKFQDTCALHTDAVTIEKIKKSTQKVLQWVKTALNWTIKTTPDAPALETQVTLAKQVEKRVDVEVNVEKAIQKEVQKYAAHPIQGEPAKTIAWERMKASPDSIEDYEAPPYLNFRTLLTRVDYEAPYSTLFPEDLLLTENFSRTFEGDIPVFHKAQKQAHQLLLIKKEERFIPLFIDMEEAGFWNEELLAHSLKDCWLVDLGGNSLHDAHPIPKEAKTSLERALWWGHFFNGDANYLRSHPHLVESELKKENYELKYRFLQLKAARDPIQTKIVAVDPLLAINPITAPIFSFASKEEEMKWSDRELSSLSDEELNQLPFHFARFISEEQIPKFKKSAFFSYLPAEKFSAITPDQVALVPDIRLRDLSTSEQVARVPEGKIKWLKGRSLELISEEKLALIDTNELAGLTPAFQEKYQAFMIERDGLEAFAARTTPRMGPVLLPALVPHLPDSVLPFLTTKEQLEKLPEAKIPFLSAKQFHLLPESAWPKLELQDFKKYQKEEVIPEDAKPLIEQMNPAWVNEVDPKLAQFFTDEQIKNIKGPLPLKHLQNASQLASLDPSLAPFLEKSQLEMLLPAVHAALIKEIKDPDQLIHLSQDALGVLTSSQVKALPSRQALLRSPTKLHSQFTKKQIEKLDPKRPEDQAVIKNITGKQAEKLDLPQLTACLPYLNSKALAALPPSTLAKIVPLPKSVFIQLTPPQLQVYLRARKKEFVPLTPFAKNITPAQWQNMEDIFLHTFFDNEPKELVMCVPKKRANALSNKTLLLRHGHNTAIDAVAGFLATLFFPLTLLAALFTGLRYVGTRRGFARAFKAVVSSPLRLFAPASYYRNRF